MTTLAAARAAYYERNDFGQDGGFADTWAEAEFGRVAYAVPNIRARAEALQVHDFHHVLTQYPTSWQGESKISAWELGSGGAGRYPYAWFIALFGFAVGLLALPRATLRAFRRGRAGRNLYRETDLGRWHDRPVDEARSALDVLPTHMRPRLRPRDLIFFAILALATLPVVALSAALAPVAIALAYLRRAHARARTECRSCCLMRQVCADAG